MRLRLSLVLAALLPMQNLMAADVHQHGIAQLDLVIEPPLLAIAFNSPLANLVGFEHRPVTAEEHADWERTLAQLQRAEELFRLPPDADCSLSRADLHLPFKLQPEVRSPAHDHGHDHNEAAHSDHADLMAEYQYLCANPRALKMLELPLLQRFPAIERLNAQLVTPSGQHQRSLNNGQTGLQLP